MLCAVQKKTGAAHRKNKQQMADTRTDGEYGFKGTYTKRFYRAAYYAVLTVLSIKVCKFFELNKNDMYS